MTTAISERELKALNDLVVVHLRKIERLQRRVEVLERRLKVAGGGEHGKKETVQKS